MTRFFGFSCPALIALATDINSQDKPLYAFVRNNQLYVVNNAEKIKNLPADMEDKDSITLVLSFWKW